MTYSIYLGEGCYANKVGTLDSKGRLVGKYHPGLDTLLDQIQRANKRTPKGLTVMRGNSSARKDRVTLSRVWAGKAEAKKKLPVEEIKERHGRGVTLRNLSIIYKVSIPQIRKALKS